MSEQKLISPLLDGFVMGEPISSHDGVRCCPAMRENSDEKYIVKIISVPASQKQLDALLLTGAYPDAASATEYFKEVADGIVAEAELLKQLSKLEGFLPYDNWQVVPMEGSRLGYNIYLLSPYKRTLEKYLRRNTMTHLGVVNLGLDLCAALSICRRAGFIHVDLKPTNIFLTGSREYRIGDLGFAKLDALKYTSLPSKYCSRYTPPELHDAMTTLNPTADIYAVGMILYEIYNNGVLPFEDKAPAAALPAPMNADYEMAEIIQKAIDPNPRKRWQTPIEMGQALVSYMQRNRVNDVPIVPPSADPIPDGNGAILDNETAAQPSEELAFMRDMVSDETAPDTDSAGDLENAEMTAEGSSILAQADELIAHETPDPTAASVPDEAPEEGSAPAEEAESADKTVPAEQPDWEDDFDLNTLTSQSAAASADEPAASDEEDEDDEENPFVIERTPKKKHAWVTIVLTVLILALLAGGGIYFYRNYYLMPIDNMEIIPSEDSITVSVTTDIDEKLLTVVCTDTYGNTLSQPVTDGKAVFTDLNPATMYKIEVEVEGFHALTGSHTGSFTTAEETEIIDFTAMTGTEDGSVILSFTVDGPEQDWIVEYSAEGEETKSVSFTGHMVTITNLTVGKTYTFSLVTAPAVDLYIVGNDTLEFTASKIVVAENLAIVSCVDGVLTAQWNAPADTAVESWTVRCYTEDGYDQTITVTEPTAQFEGISSEYDYTVEVTAAGMTQNTRAYVTANPTTISDIHVDDSNPEKLTVSWESNGIVPEAGWLMMYSTDGGRTPEVVKCAENSGVIDLRIPAATYTLSIQAADGSTVFGGETTYESPEAEVYNDKSFDASKASASLCPTPDKEDWTYEDVADDDYTSTHAPGAKVSIVIYTPKKPIASYDETDVMFVIRDSEGNVLSNLTAVKTFVWNDLWHYRDRYCGVDIPAVPTEPGSYTVEIYFDNCFVVRKALNITE